MLMILPLAVARTLPAQQASSHTLVYAVYEGEATAAVLARMRKAQHAAGEQIESDALLSRTPKGKIAAHRWPAELNPAIEAMLANLGEPSSGAADAIAIPGGVVDSLRTSLAPGSSAVIAVLDDRWVSDLRRELQAARARPMMFRRITQDPIGAGAP